MFFVLRYGVTVLPYTYVTWRNAQTKVKGNYMATTGNGNGNAATTPATTATPAQGNATLYYRRMHPGGGPLGRCSYGVPGVPGIVVFDVALFANNTPPATLTLQGVTLATPKPRNVAGVTSAVVAAGNVAATVASGAPTIASPAGVAAVAAKVTGAKVAAAAHKAGK